MAEALTKAQLLDALTTTGDDAAARLRALPASGYEDGRYENGWNARQILAHIAAIEWTYARLVDLAQDAAPSAATEARPAASQAEVRRTTPDESPSVASRPMRGGIDDYNARQVEKRAEASVAELIDEFAANRARTIAAVGAMDDTLATRPVRSAGGITGTLTSVIYSVAVDHVMSHVGDITGEPWHGRR